MEVVHLQSLNVRHHQNELFVLYDRVLKFCRYQSLFHDQHDYVLYENLLKA
ncbi:50S ribosomal protein L15 [Listeria monocytogenes]|nr:50S ribosomal protein L15 [Listeria monocytogenes]GAT39619.1 50S ribosomal protein L15 [Listeria monocytogenes]GAT41863.1 50S ribosomal protein L15 [Listeria monocytogenes]